MTDQEGKPAHPPFDRVVADNLLSRLEDDDAFREMFTRDPEEALRAVGHTDPAAALQGASCMRVSRLASKEEIRASRELLQQDLTSTGAHTVVYAFEAGEVRSSLRKK